jgi:hypothetical protein
VTPHEPGSAWDDWTHAVGLSHGRTRRSWMRFAPKLFVTPTSPSSITTQAVGNQVIETMSTAALRLPSPRLRFRIPRAKQGHQRRSDLIERIGVGDALRPGVPSGRARLRFLGRNVSPRPLPRQMRATHRLGWTFFKCPPNLLASSGAMTRLPKNRHFGVQRLPERRKPRSHSQPPPHVSRNACSGT